MQQIIAIGDKCAKNVKVQTAVWKLVREITLMHPYRLQVGSTSALTKRFRSVFSFCFLLLLLPAEPSPAQPSRHAVRPEGAVELERSDAMRAAPGAES